LKVSNLPFSSFEEFGRFFYFSASKPFVRMGRSVYTYG